MGYKVARTVYKLIFDGRDGMVVKARALTIAERIEYNALKTDTEVLAFFAEHALVEWTLEDENDGTPLPMTGESLMAMEPDFVDEILEAWRTAGSKVAAPLEKPSNDGDLELEASMPMGDPSVSLAS